MAINNNSLEHQGISNQRDVYHAIPPLLMT